MRRGLFVLRVGLALAVLLSSLSLVVRRQSRALELLRATDRVRRERSVLEAARAELVQEVRFLESRRYVVPEAQDRLGMHVPAGSEIVILPSVGGAVRPGTDPGGRGGEAGHRGGAGGVR